MSKELSTTIEQIENGTPADKVITLKSVFKAGKFTVQPARNSENNWFHGIPRLSEDDKRKLDYFTTPDSKLTLTDNYQFDLNEVIPKENWKWVKHLPCIAMSFEEAQMSPSAQFYVHIAGREAREANKVSDLKYKATKYIMEDSPVNYENRALILDNDLSGESPEQIKTVLLGIAERQPTRVIAAYEAKDLGIRLLYLRATQKGIIVKKDGVVLFGSNVLGVDQAGALAYLRAEDHKQILKLLEQEVETVFSIENEDKPASSKKNWNFNK